MPLVKSNIYPECFFSTIQDGSMHEYTTDFTGNMDVTRLLNGHNDYFIREGQQTYTKRKLVINLWSLQIYQQDKIEKIQYVLRQLIDDGFEVYLWRYANLEKLSIANLNILSTACLPYNENFYCYHSKSAVLQIAVKKLQISEHNIYVVGEDTISFLLNEDNARALSIADFAESLSTNNHNARHKIIADYLSIDEGHFIRDYLYYGNKEFDGWSALISDLQKNSRDQLIEQVGFDSLDTQVTALNLSENLAIIRITPHFLACSIIGNLTEVETESFSSLVRTQKIQSLDITEIYSSTHDCGFIADLPNIHELNFGMTCRVSELCKKVVAACPKLYSVKGSDLFLSQLLNDLKIPTENLINLEFAMDNSIIMTNENYPNLQCVTIKKKFQENLITITELSNLSSIRLNLYYRDYIKLSELRQLKCIPTLKNLFISNHELIIDCVPDNIGCRILNLFSQNNSYTIHISLTLLKSLIEQNIAINILKNVSIIKIDCPPSEILTAMMLLQNIESSVKNLIFEMPSDDAILELSASKVTLTQNMLPFVELFSCNAIDANDLIAIFQAMPQIKTFYVDKAQNLTTNIVLQNLLMDKETNIEQQNPIHHVPQYLGASSTIIYPEDARYDPREYLNYKPQSSDQLTTRYKNQDMINKKLCAYLIIIQKNNDYIDNIKKGTCAALARLFCFFIKEDDGDTRNWDDFITEIFQWDETFESLANNLRLQDYLNTLFDFFEASYIRPQFKNSSLHYFDRHLERALKQLPTNQPVVLKNSWHRIAISKINCGYILYDPNYVQGYKKIAHVNLVVAEIKKSIGECFAILNYPKNNSVFSPNFTYEPIITDVDMFIAHGGLLLLKNDNLYVLPRLIDICSEHRLNQSGLQGLLLCDNAGVPAWLCCNNSSNFKYSQSLHYLIIFFLEQFKKAYPNDYCERLNNSMQQLTDEERELHATAWWYTYSRLAVSQEQKILIAELYDVITLTPSVIANYKQLFTTDDLTEDATTIVELPEALQNHKKILLTTSSNNYKALPYCIAKTYNLSLFCIRDAHELTLPHMYIQRLDDDTGIVQTGEHGALFRFFQSIGTNPCVLLIDLEEFQETTVVLSTVLGETKIQGMQIPDNCIIIATSHNKHNDKSVATYFDVTVQSPFTTDALAESLPPMQLLDETESDDIIIDLYHSHDWAKILGQWIFNKDGAFVFYTGELVKQLNAETCSRIVFCNPPTNNKEFENFYNNLIAFRTIELDSCTLNVPESIEFSCISREYNLAAFKGLITQDSEGDDLIILNPQTLNAFFDRHYICDNTIKSFRAQIGHIENHANSTLNVLLTRALPPHVWVMLLTECKKHQVKLAIYVPDMVIVPEDLQTLVIPYTTESISQLSHTEIIVSDDIDASIQEYDDENNLLLDISNYNVNDLFGHVSTYVNAADNCFEFTQLDSIILSALNNDQTVVLYGKAANLDYLKDSLNKVLYERYIDTNTKGRLVLVVDREGLFPVLPSTNHRIDFAQKLQYLARNYQVDEATLARLTPYSKESFAKLRLRAKYILSHAHVTDEDIANLNRKTASPMDILSVENMDVATSAQLAREFNERRLEDIQHGLEHFTIELLEGPTGSGKSKITEQIQNLYTIKNIKTWATNGGILFIDEANLGGDGNFDKFKTLLNKKPFIIIEGELFELNATTHQVLFAGNNTETYQAGRKKISLLEDNGYTVYFNPLSLEVMFEGVLKPIFMSPDFGIDFVDQDILTICKPFLSIYSAICSYSEDNILISPRELQTMALLTLSNITPHASLKEIVESAKTYAYQVGYTVVPLNNRREFNAAFQGANRDFAKYTRRQYQEILGQSIELSTKLRRLQNDETHVPKFNYGLPIVLLTFANERENNQKALVRESLERRGYFEHDWRASLENLDKSTIYYTMSLAMTFAEKEALLTKATTEGIIVVTPQFNCSPNTEQLILKGVTLKSAPGFMMIGMQDPMTLKGRHQISDALRCRSYEILIPKFSQRELSEIITSRGTSRYLATTLAAIANNDPHLTPTDLISITDEIDNAHIRHVYPQNTAESEVLFRSQLTNSHASRATSVAATPRLTPLANALTPQLNDLSRWYVPGFTISSSLIVLGVAILVTATALSGIGLGIAFLSLGVGIAIACAYKYNKTHGFDFVNRFFSDVRAPQPQIDSRSEIQNNILAE